jgi:hypothetical protein
MNTKSKQDQKKQRPRTRQEHGQKKRVQNRNVYQEHEHPEARLTR